MPELLLKEPENHATCRMTTRCMGQIMDPGPEDQVRITESEPDGLLHVVHIGVDLLLLLSVGPPVAVGHDLRHLAGKFLLHVVPNHPLGLGTAQQDVAQRGSVLVLQDELDLRPAVRVTRQERLAEARLSLDGFENLDTLRTELLVEVFELVRPRHRGQAALCDHPVEILAG